MKTSRRIFVAMAILLSLLPLNRIYSRSLLDSLGHVPTPQAADLGRFGDFPVSYFTGRAQVSIPIRTYSCRGITLDVNLSYDTSGLRMNQLPGVVGPGWTLNAGGVITRDMHNFADERTFDGHPYVIFQNYFSSHSELPGNKDDIVDNGPHRDYEPDFFYFNFMGHTGYFFLGHDGEWKMCSESNLCVEFDVADKNNYVYPIFSTFPSGEATYKQPKSIRGFKIYDDEGNKYTFGFAPESIEYSMPFFHASDAEGYCPWTATSWYLTKVEDRCGNIIYHFSYLRGKFIGQLFKSRYVESKNKVDFGTYSVWSSIATSYTGSLNIPSYLSSITTINGESLTFVYKEPYSAGTAAKNLYPSLYNTNGTEKFIADHVNYSNLPFYYLQKLYVDSISQYRAYNSYDLSNNPLKALDFKLLKFIGIDDGLTSSSLYNFDYDSIGRIHLSRISACHIADRYSGIDTLLTYSFKYNDFHSLPTDYLTDIYDHWGYYTNPYQFGNELQRREPNFNYAVRGSLKEITYPTGGRSVFDYELNTYSAVLSQDRQSLVSESGNAGGLRIKSIREYDSSDDASLVKTRTFSYNSDSGTSSGQLFQRPVYYWNFKVGGNDISVYQSVPALSLTTASGLCVGYSDVTETFGDGTTHTYHYSNYSDVKDETAYDYVTDAKKKLQYDMTGTPYDRFGEMDFMRGKLLSERVLSPDGQVISSKQYTYRTDPNIFKAQFSYAANIVSIFNIHEAGNFYKIYYPKYDIEKVVSSVRYGQQMVTDTTYYSMTTFDTTVGNWNTRPYFRKCSTEKVCRGTTSTRTVYTYHSSQTDKYFIPVKTASTYFGSSLLRRDATEYSSFQGHDQPEWETTSISASAPDTLVKYHAYTAKGFPKSYTRAGEFTTTLFWNFRGQLMASITSPYPENQLSYNEPNKGKSGLGNIINGKVNPHDIVTKDGKSIFDFPDVKAVVYSYNKGKLSMSCTSSGEYNYYYYDPLGRLIKIVDQDGHILKQYLYNYFTSSGQ